MCPDATDEEIDELLNIADTNGDGKLDPDGTYTLNPLIFACDLFSRLTLKQNLENKYLRKIDCN